MPDAIPLTMLSNDKHQTDDLKIYLVPPCLEAALCVDRGIRPPPSLPLLTHTSLNGLQFSGSIFQSILNPKPFLGGATKAQVSRNPFPSRPCPGIKPRTLNLMSNTQSTKLTRQTKFVKDGQISNPYRTY